MRVEPSLKGLAPLPAVYGVAQSQTRLKRLSSSSSKRDPRELPYPIHCVRTQLQAKKWTFTRHRICWYLDLGEESTYNAGDLCLIPESGRFPGGGNGYTLQYFCLENSMDRGAWWAAVHGVAKSETRLSN